MATNRDDLVTKMANARAQLDAALEQVAPQMDIYPTWKLKQLIDHITGWDELVANALRTHARGENPEVSVKHGIDRYNAASVEERKELSLVQSRQAYVAAREDVLHALQEMPEDKLGESFRAPWGGKCTVSSVVRIFVSHELEHARQIETHLVKSQDSV